jgi:hypothetical protein
VTPEEATRWVTRFRLDRPDLTDERLLQAACILSADKPRHPLCVWARSFARASRREEG